MTEFKLLISMKQGSIETVIYEHFPGKHYGYTNKSVSFLSESCVGIFHPLLCRLSRLNCGEDLTGMAVWFHHGPSSLLPGTPGIPN